MSASRGAVSFWTVVATLIAVGAAPVSAAPVDNFALLDHTGTHHTLYAQSHQNLIVLFIQGNGCPISRGAIPALREARDRFAPQGVTFWLLNANPQDDRVAIAAEANAYEIDFPILMDDSQLVAESLNVARTAEALVIDPDGWQILYRGPVDDSRDYGTQRPARSHYLADAIEAHLASKPIEVAQREPRGCLILFPDQPGDRSAHRHARSDAAGTGYAHHGKPHVSGSNSERSAQRNADTNGTPQPEVHPTYTNHIAPILDQHCRTCHQPGGVAPFAMTDYGTVRGWSPMIRESLRTGRMPPWHADPRYGRFANDISLTPEERRTLVHWVEAGAPRGPGTDPLAERAPPPLTGAPLGTPDYVVELPEQTIPATGVVPYLYATVELPFGQDVWVRAVDLRPSNPQVMHHGLAFLLYPDGEALPDSQGPRFTRGMFAGYVPGREARAFPPESGYRVPAGSRLRFQLHYTTTGRPETDRPRLALYLSREALRHQLRTGAAARFDFEIPPGADDHEETAVQEIDRDILLYRLTPHMHYRGKRMRYEARYPDGSVEVLLSVPRYDFNWQRQYVLDPPKRIPAGTMLVVKAAFDNSARNPANPDPERFVYYGEQSFEEMLFGYFLYRDLAPELQTANMPVPPSH